MATIAKHTNYLIINEKGKLEIVTYSPEQNFSGQSASDSYALAQGLFINEISHELWIGDVKCHRVVGTPSGLHTIKDLNCKIVAKQTYDWDMSKPLGQRQTNIQKSKKWDETFTSYKSK
jgi:hypothetical protein